MNFDSRNYDWSETEVAFNGRVLTSIQGIAYNLKQAKSFLYGKGVNPLAIKKGNKSLEGTMTVTMAELQNLKDEAPNRELVNMRNVTIQVAYSNQDEGGGDVNRDSLLGVEFTEEPVDIKQGDPTAVVALPFMALRRRSL